jgi:hypothetical protein
VGFLLNRFSVVIPQAEESEYLFLGGGTKKGLGVGWEWDGCRLTVGGFSDLQHLAPLFASSLLLHRIACQNPSLFLPSSLFPV